MWDQTNAGYQSDAVAAYLALGVGLPPAASFNPKGRGTPVKDPGIPIALKVLGFCTEAEHLY